MTTRTASRATHETTNMQLHSAPYVRKEDAPMHLTYYVKTPKACITLIAAGCTPRAASSGHDALSHLHVEISQAAHLRSLELGMVTRAVQVRGAARHAESPRPPNGRVRCPRAQSACPREATGVVWIRHGRTSRSNKGRITATMIPSCSLRHARAV
jgi:hypothetical protein